MKTGLVLEGGGCRGVFTSGVLDLFQERGLWFDYCVGVSAGAGNAMNYKSCQPGRALALSAGEDSPVYYGFSQARKSGKLLDLDLVYNRLSFEPPYPFDFARYYENPMACEYVVTCCETGQAVYLEETVYRKRLVDIVKASCSMPGLCAPVEIDGAHYLDGGIADPMPVSGPWPGAVTGWCWSPPSLPTICTPRTIPGCGPLCPGCTAGGIRPFTPP